MHMPKQDGPNTLAGDQVPALDFVLLAKIVKQQDEEEEDEQKAAEKAAAEAAELAKSTPLPAGWETAESRSTGLVYYVNTKTGAAHPLGPSTFHSECPHGGRSNTV
jgi:hypothetical protein